MKLFKKVVAYVCAAAMVAGTLTMSGTEVEAAKKKVKLSKKTYNVKVGKTVKIKVKNSVKKAKITWKSAKPKVVKITKKKNGKNAYAKVKALKKGKVKVTATYKVGKKKTKLKCTVVAKKDDNKATATPVAVVPTLTPVNPTPVPTATPEPFTIINNQKADVMMYIDKNDSEYDGISLIAEAFKADVARVIGVGTDEEGVANESPNGLTVTTDSSALSGKAIIAGTIGDSGNSVIKDLVSAGKLNVSDIQGKWECYKLQVVKNPMPGVSEALVIAGSDKRGTIYGIFRISELMGVSPWVWWADATPAVQSKVDLLGVDVNTTSKEPSVKYRGIFLNDEAPSLTNWTDRRYGGRNHTFYKQVFELILRLKGDYLWPAMWGNEFSKDGVEGLSGSDGNTLANAELADQYGIVMGTSHHEPLYRAGNEWGQEYGQYKGSLTLGSAAAWNTYNLPGEDGYNEKVNEAIEKFWRDGVRRNGTFDNLCTVGMRGEADSELPAANDPPKYAELLNHIISTQKNILAEEGDVNPTQLVVYKEVENAWNEGALYEQDCMKDTIAMMCDDNWAYIRTLPTYDQQQMVGGLGMYYHFDYVGAPKSYTWIQTTQLSRIWDQMSVAYDYSIDDVWVVNVGDLKPMEMDISYFLDLGYDYEKWGTNGQDKLAEYKIAWVKQQLGAGLTDAQVAEASRLIEDYLDLETLRKVEHVLFETASSCSDMFSVTNYNEAQEVLMRCNDMIARADDLMAQVPDSVKAAFYQLVYYPAVAVPNVLKIQIYAALNQKYAGMGLTVANTYKELCEDAIALDQELYDRYNNDMPGGSENGRKWNGMQSADQRYHIGMTAWNTDSGKLPTLRTVNGSGESGLAVLTEAITDSFTTVVKSGDASLPAFTNTNKEVYTIELANEGGSAYNFTATPSADWIVLDKTSGTVNSFAGIQVSVDWSKVTASTSGSIAVSDGTSTVNVAVTADVTDVSKLAANTYVMANDYATIDVARFSAAKAGKGTSNDGTVINNSFVVVPDNGKYLTSLRTTASTVTYSDANLADAPYVEYTVYVPQGGEYQLECQFNPTSNLEYGNTQLRYGISVDGGSVTIKNSIVNDYLAGTWKQGTWATDIEKNSRASVIDGINLTAGVHTIRYYQCDPNMALIRMTLSADKLATKYGAPEESYYVGKPANDMRLNDKKYMYDAVSK